MAGSPDSVVVFNEIHYNPEGSSEEGEWLELFNQMGIKTDVSGWRIAGIGYTFPPGIVIEPGAYLVVAKNPGPGQLGPFPGNLSNGGELLELINQSDRLMDEIEYGDSGRWPVAPDGSGATLAKRMPYLPNKPPENWTASVQVGGTPGGPNFPAAGEPDPTTILALLALDSDWRFNEEGGDLGAGWAATEHPVDGTSWRSGPGVHAFESGLAHPVGTPLRFPNLNDPYVITYYFETEFVLDSAQLADLQSLQIRHLIDDGAVFYLNGVEVARTGMPAGAVDASTFASANVEAVLSSGLPLPTGSLVAGTNRISVEVHQAELGSSDVVFGLELEAATAVSASGAPALRLSEVPPADAVPYWVELTNVGAGSLDVGGIVLSVGGDPEREHVLAPQSLAPGGFLVVDEATLGFRPLAGENHFLYDAGRSRVLDAQRQTNRLRGRAGARDGAWLYPDSATPGAPNSFAFRDEIVISEIQYNPPALAAVPEIPPTFDTTTLVGFNDAWRYNDGDESLPGDWATRAHAIGGNWKSAAAVFGFETGSLPEPIVTTLPNPALASPFVVTYYFEREFALTAQQLAATDSLTLTHQIDDGAVFYLNGSEVGRFNMAAGPVTPETLASTGVGDAVLLTLDIPPAALLTGANRLSVEVHQASLGSSDIVFGLRLDARTAVSPGIPGQPLRNSDNQWIEIANRGASAVDLGGWAFEDGIGFTFPAGTLLAPGEHACLARSPAEFGAAYPGARLLGEFSGNLSRAGERLYLVDASGNPADEVRYFDGGRWPEAPDGGGATLELRDLDADNAAPGAWGASDESAQTAWKTYSYRGTLVASRGNDAQWSEFNLGLLGAGEILIDDLSVVEDPDGAATQILSNPTFSAGATGWRLRGNHRHSGVTDDPEIPGEKVLRILAAGPTEHMHNQIETTLTKLAVNGRDYEISFRARWVSGSNQLHTRLYFHRLPQVTTIERPVHVGTPSAPNSQAVPNIGPTVTGLVHSPPVPAPGQAVTVTARASDPDGVSGLALRYSVDGGTFQAVAMSPAPGGVWQGAIPGQSAAAIVQIYVTATDEFGNVASFPAAGPGSRALYKVEDGLAAANGQHNFRIVVTGADRDHLHRPVEVMSNDRIGATIIDREQDIYYDVSLRLKGSQRGRNQSARVGFNLRFGPDQPYRGIHQSLAIDRSEGVTTGQREILTDMMIANSGGVLSRYYDFIKVIAPHNQHTGSAVLQMARYDDVFLDSQFDDGSSGNLYEYELIYYPTTADPNGFKIPEPDTVIGVPVTDLGDGRENYRWFFLKKGNREADDFDPIIRYAKHFAKSGAAFEEGLDEVVAVDSWLRGMAYAVLSGAGDNAAAGDAHNGLYYAFPEGRVTFFPHDMDLGFSATRSIFANQECAKLTSDSTRRRIYLGHLHDIITTTFNAGYMSMWTDHFAGLDPSQPWGSHLSFINSRSNNVLSQISQSVPQIPFGITAPSPLTVGSSSATISGSGWINVREIRVQGQPGVLEVTWTDGNSWQVSVPVPPGQSAVTLEAVSFSGEVIGTATIAVENTGDIEPASAANLAISEIMYHPADPTAAELAAGFAEDNDFEYLELMNIGARQVSLDGARFDGGIDFDLPAQTVPPGARVIVARNRAAFLARNPAAVDALLAGGYAIGDTNKLSNGGEEIRLVDAFGAEIRRFTYSDSLPWPTAPDGDGYSLVLIAPESNPDHAIPANWRSSAYPGGSPATSDSTTFSGDPDADDDGDGITNFLAYALGHGAPPIALTPDPANPGAYHFSYQRNLAADDVTTVVDSSDDLSTWSPDGFGYAGSISLGDGTALEFWSSSAPPGAAPAFVRLRATGR
ncbi:hypothetical protein BH23VER1_BH23VER1_32050 [soil metagenome]